MNNKSKETTVLKVAATSSPSSVAGALAAIIRTESEVELQMIGAGAVNQALKAVAIARGYVAPEGYNLVCVPAFKDIKVNDEERTAMKLTVMAW